MILIQLSAFRTQTSQVPEVHISEEFPSLQTNERKMQTIGIPPQISPNK